MSGPLAVGHATAGAKTWGITGRRLTGPMQGFGRLWQRTYTCPIGLAATPQEAIAAWRAHFGDFWPGKSRFYGALEGINPGDVAPISVNTGAGLKLSTGVLVLQTQVLIRPNDPLYELGMPVMKVLEDRFWSATMRNLARHLGAMGDRVAIDSHVVDRGRLWRNAGNVRYNAAICGALRLVAAPFAAGARVLRS